VWVVWTGVGVVLYTQINIQVELLQRNSKDYDKSTFTGFSSNYGLQCKARPTDRQRTLRVANDNNAGLVERQEEQLEQQ